MSKVNLEKIARPKVTRERFMSRYLPLYIMILPIVVYYAVMVYKPMVGLVIAFQDYSPYKGIDGSSWVGLKHFVNFFKTPTVGRLFRNSIMLNVWSLLILAGYATVFMVVANIVIIKRKNL